MTFAPYVPKPGSVPARALAHLRTLPEGAEISTAQLADAIGVESKQIPATMATIVRARQVYTRSRVVDGERAQSYWSLVDQQQRLGLDLQRHFPAVVRSAPAEVEQRITLVRDSQQVLKAEPATADATDRETPAMRSPVGGPTGAGQPAAAGPVAEPDLKHYVSAIADRHPPDAAPATTKRGLRVAAWSTGELAIEIDGGEVILFEKPLADQVVAFCRRIGGGV